ncbi:helix-turn-helix domain-containing protein [Oceanicola granulosus]|uniref:helix-turn-helix domain-containing protein n=1 Tax=Oceanicola granulosus TaxID=252302 RepID=UPI000A0550D8
MFTRIGVRLQSPNSSRGPRSVYSREQIVARIAAGRSAAEVADAFGVSVRTVRKWVARFRAGGRDALSNCASVPARVANRLPDRLVLLINSRNRPGFPEADPADNAPVTLSLIIILLLRHRPSGAILRLRLIASR